MPVTKTLIGTFNRGTVHEYEERFETHWVGIIGPGPKIIRCDNEAMDSGYGVWSVQDMGSSTGSRSQWLGRVRLSDDPSIPFEDIAWVKDTKVWRRTIEKDYS